MKKIWILITAIVLSIPLFFITLALFLSGFIIGANIIMSISLIGYPLLAIWVLKNSDKIIEKTCKDKNGGRK